MKRFLLLFFCLVMVLPAFAQKQPLGANTILEGDRYKMVISNFMQCPVYLKIEPIKSSGDIDFEYEEVQVIPSGELAYVVTTVNSMTPADTAEFKFSEYFEYNFEIGDPFKSKHAKKYVYDLPFPEGKSYEVIQGFKGSYSHNKPSSRYAIDFKMAVGDAVCAAREGIVAKIIEHNTEGGRDKEKYYGKDNHLVILHDDGTLGYYVHLDTDGILVEMGDKVEKGQVIAISGDTGWSTRPHLHFVVRVPTEKGPIAVPVNFEEIKGKKLKKGVVVTNN